MPIKFYKKKSDKQNTKYRKFKIKNIKTYVYNIFCFDSDINYLWTSENFPTQILLNAWKMCHAYDFIRHNFKMFVLYL